MSVPLPFTPHPPGQLARVSLLAGAGVLVHAPPPSRTAHTSFALGLYKCWTMGILPSGPADWLQFETRPAWPEWSAVRALILDSGK